MFKKLFHVILLVLILPFATKTEGFSTGLPLQASFVANSFEAGQGEVFLVLTIDKGWKLYAPPKETDTLAYSPKLSLEKSKNLAAADPEWPEGMSSLSNDLQGHVYKNAVIVPLQVRAKDSTKPVLLEGLLQGLVCSETACQPIQLVLNFTLDQKAITQNPQKELQKILQTVATPLPTEKEGVSLLTILFLALLGGLMLNVMPCVLPVLGVKLMVFAKTKASPAGFFPVKDLWMTVFGIYATFATFALITLILKGLGETIGWGVHFQNPYFLSFMIVVLILFTANTWGFFELSSPSWAQRYATFGKFRGWKPFFSGVLSVLLATPCATPFVGTAVGFALARDSLEIFSVFSALAIGFSSPYWVTALLPSHKLPLPKSGPWLLIFQRFLGFLLLGTIIWLSILLVANHSLSFVCLVIGFIFTAFLSFFGIHKGKGWMRLPLAASLLLLLSTPLFPNEWWTNPLGEKLAPSASEWAPFAPENIPEHVARGQVVFVDLTASWCLTCHVNKKLVLQTSAVEKLLTAPNTIRMRGDWTQPNPVISNFLKHFQKAGIPFNVVFGPNASEGISLPEILSVDDVRKAIQQARGAS